MSELTYDWFLQHGPWPDADTYRQIVDRWYASDTAQRRALLDTDIRHILFRLIFEASRYSTVEAATADWYDAPSIPPVPTRGVLGFDGSAVTQHGQRVLPVGVHVGDLAMCWVEGKHQLVIDALDDMRGFAAIAGKPVVARTWESINWHVEHPFWAGRQLNPSRPAVRDALIELYRLGTESYGIQWHTCLGDSIQVDDATEDDFWDWKAGVVRRHPHWFAAIEAGNEIYGTGDRDDWDPAEMEQQIQIVRRVNPQHLYFLSAAAGEGSEMQSELQRWTPDWMRMAYYHASRAGRWGDMLRHMFGVAYEDPFRPGLRLWSGEPPGMNLRGYYHGDTGTGAWVSGMDHPEDFMLEPWRYACYLAATALFRQVPCFMSTHGVKLEGRLRDVPGWRETAQLFREIPDDAMASTRLFHGGERFRDRRVIAARDTVRADHAEYDDGRIVIVVYPNSEPVIDVALDVEREWHGTLIDKHGVQRDTWLTPGRWDVDISTGVILIGDAG